MIAIVFAAAWAAAVRTAALARMPRSAIRLVEQVDGPNGVRYEIYYRGDKRETKFEFDAHGRR